MEGVNPHHVTAIGETDSVLCAAVVQLIDGIFRRIGGRVGSAWGAAGSEGRCISPAAGCRDRGRHLGAIHRRTFRRRAGIERRVEGEVAFALVAQRERLLGRLADNQLLEQLVWRDRDDRCRDALPGHLNRG